MIIDCFAEDVDFPNGVSVAFDSTSTTLFRPGFARGCIALDTQTGIIKSTQFPTGPVTSCWLKFRFAYGVNGTPASIAVIGLGNSSSGDGLYFGCNHGSGSNALFLAVNIGTRTGAGVLNNLAFAPNIINLGQLYTIDMQVINYGPAGTVNLYCNGTLVLTYTGNLTVGSAANFDSVFIRYDTDNSSQYRRNLSEIIVADESTLGWQGLVTAAPNGNGTTQQWLNPAYTNINPIIINDANSSYTDVVGQDQQVTLIPEPAGNYAIKAVKVVARANGPAGAIPTGIKLGFRNSSGAVAVNPAHAITTAFEPYLDIFETDPITGQPWSDMTGYQLDMRSA